jgi:Nucleotide modification associated domain 2
LTTGRRPIRFAACAHWLFASPYIRRAAKQGDWVAGLGAKNAPGGDLSSRLVYAMHIDEVVSLEDYDMRARTDRPHRIPNVDSADLSERLGDPSSSPK